LYGRFRPQENDEELLGPKVSYLSVIRVLMYLTNYTRLHMAFFCKFKQDMVLHLQEDIVPE